MYVCVSGFNQHTSSAYIIWKIKVLFEDHLTHAETRTTPQSLIFNVTDLDYDKSLEFCSNSFSISFSDTTERYAHICPPQTHTIILHLANNIPSEQHAMSIGQKLEVLRLHSSSPSLLFLPLQASV